MITIVSLRWRLRSFVFISARTSITRIHKSSMEIYCCYLLFNGNYSDTWN
jgi:hypothetical protein